MLNNLAPGFPTADGPDRHLTHSVVRGDCALSFSVSKPTPNDWNVGFGKPGVSVPTASSAAENSGRMEAVRPVGDVFEIPCGVVGFSAVDVVDLMSRRPRPKERRGDQSVNGRESALADSSSQGYGRVPIRVHSPAKNFTWVGRPWLCSGRRNSSSLDAALAADGVVIFEPNHWKPDLSRQVVVGRLSLGGHFNSSCLSVTQREVNT